MRTLKLVSISEVKTENRTADSKPARKFYTAYFMDPINPFAKQQQRNFFQDHVGEKGSETCVWKSGDPAIVSKFVGKEIPGQIISCNVEPYKIDGRAVNSFTTVLLESDKLTSVLKQAGHVLAEEVKYVIKKEPEEILPISSNTALNK